MFDRFKKAKGKHGRGEILNLPEKCAALSLSTKRENAVCKGGTVWCEGVLEKIAAHQPDIIVQETIKI